MGQRAIFLAIVFGSACSVIYNPNNIPRPRPDAPPDAAPDAPAADANPAALTLTSVEPSALLEGQGSDGGRPEVLVIHGQNIVSGAQVTIAPMGSGAMPMVSLAGSAVASSDHTMLAVPVEADVNTTCPAAGATSGTIPLVVTVTQNGTVMQTIPWSLTCLPDIDQSGSGTCSGLGSGVSCTGNLSLSTNAPNQFSRIVLTGNDTITYVGAQPLIVRTTGMLSVGGAISVSAAGTTAGPGGRGPSTGDSAGKNGGAGAVLGILGPNIGGGGAGYASSGDNGANSSAANGSGGSTLGSDAIPSFATNYASGGGNYAVSSSNTNSGGAGAGTIELTAGGSLTVAGGIDAKGAQGSNGAGGGAGGTIVLGAGTTIELDANLDVSGGPANGSGGAGSVGRVRINTPAPLQGAGVLAGTGPGGPPTSYRGLAFDPSVPYATTMSQPSLAVHGTAGKDYILSVRDEATNVTMTSGTLGADSASIHPMLSVGLNTVCLLEPGGTLDHPEAMTCVDIAYVP